jgi:2,5-diketo-D-gluconate reductase B
MTRFINKIPVFGLGTWSRTGEEGTALIKAALALGYRHLDTAQSYDTEASVGRAIKESGVPRAEVFITTKVATVNLARDKFLPSFEGSLRKLRVDQIDLTLIHWPSPVKTVPFEHYIEDLAKAQDRGYTRLIGVSNFPIALLQKAEQILGRGRIVNNQVEVHPYLQNRTLREYCTEVGISVTAYMPLAKGKVASDPVLQRIGRNHGATAAQVALAFLLQEGMIVIPASSRPENLTENLEALDLHLHEEELRQIRALDRGERLVNPPVPPPWDA